MADPLLTSLCSICHIAPPKYKCPRCEIRTCSLACVKKHKSWSDCSGERDPTVYIPPSKLRTAAGIDHDYNFLHGIELATERAERVLVGDKGILQTKDLRPLTTEDVKWKTGRDGRKRKVLVTRLIREDKERKIDKLLAQRLEKLNVDVMCAPVGMSRQKENNTTLNKRTGRINWQVEWFTFEAGKDGQQQQQPTRALSKAMDDLPLYQAYHALLEQQAKARGLQPERAPRGSAQKPSDSRWTLTNDVVQDPSNGTWVTFQGPSLDMWPDDKDQAQRRQFQFFLARPQTRSDLPTTITRMDSGDCFRDILTNTRVLEFPTIYVLKEGEAIPSGFVLGEKYTIPPKQQQQQQQQQQGAKRKGGPQAGKKAVQPAKKTRRLADLEEGEVGGEEDGDSGSKGQDGLELDVIAELSLGEEDDEEDDDDDGTSSDDSTSSDDETSSAGSDSKE